MSGQCQAAISDSTTYKHEVMDMPWFTSYISDQTNENGTSVLFSTFVHLVLV